MKFLFVTPYLPSPPRFGAQRRIDGLMRGLSARNEVSLLTFMGSDGDPESSLSTTRDYCREVVAIRNDVIDMDVRQKRLMQFRSLFSRRSFEYLLLHSDEFQVRFDEMLRHNQYDVVQVEFMHMGIYQFPARRQRRTLFVLDEHNVEYDLIRRVSQAEGSLSRKLYSAVDWRKLKMEEGSCWRRFDGVALTSERDEKLLLHDAPETRTVVVPNAVDLDSFRPMGGHRDPATLLFFGAMNYHPNIDGILHFVVNTFPKIVAQCPEVKLTIIGQNPPDSVAKLANDRITVTGFVNDPRPEIDRASVLIVPLRIGGGTRFKIVEGMAMGAAIVSTRVGAEGLDVRHEKNILLADEPEAFAEQVVRALSNPSLCERLGLEARKLAEQCYGWDNAVTRLEDFYRRIQG